MSKLFAIYAYEEMYMGAQGMHDYMVTEADSLDEATEIARDMATNVAENYSEIYMEIFYTTVEQFCTLDEYEEMTEAEKANLYNSEEFISKYVENRNDIIRYEVVELDETLTRGLTLDYLNEFSFKEVCDMYGK